jgi:holo-[acyl-carrier protein] synthase
MKIKVGTDIIQISRVLDSTERFGDKFLKRFLNEEEIQELKKVESIAGYWAAKEAIAKAFGCGIGKELSFLDIFIKKDSLNSPSFILSQEAQKKFNLQSSSLSISHDGNFAIAVAIVVLS